MARSSPLTDVALVMLRDLVAAEELAQTLAATAPIAVAEAGGAHALVSSRGRRTGAWFWTVAPLSEAFWEQMAYEHQVQHRWHTGDQDASRD